MENFHLLKQVCVGWLHITNASVLRTGDRMMDKIKSYPSLREFVHQWRKENKLNVNIFEMIWYGGAKCYEKRDTT